MSASTTGIDQLISRAYLHGFVTDMEADALPRGLSEDVVRSSRGRLETLLLARTPEG